VAWLSPLAAGLVPLALVGMLAASHRAAAAGRLHPEVARKSLHVAMGVLALGFPWLFASPPWFLAALGLSVAALVAVRAVPALARTVGAGLHGVDRRSWGELYLAAAIGFLYFAAGDTPALYVAPLAVVALADAVAALTGVFYGRARYDGAEGLKSWEGSTLFFLTAFICLHVTVLLGTPLGRLDSLLVALALAAIATAVEGAAWRGLDNLLLPLGLFLLLEGFLEVAARDPGPGHPVGLVSTGVVALLILAAMAARRLGWRVDALMAILVFGYAFWAAHGFALLLPGALVLGVGYLLYRRRPRATPAADAPFVAAVGGPVLLAVVAHRQWPAFDPVAAGWAGMAAGLVVFALAVVGRWPAAAAPERRFRLHALAALAATAAAAAATWTGLAPEGASP
jgi:phytol kinase